MLFLIPFAAATSGFPTEVANHESMSCTPTCTLCHATNAGGSGTVSQPFGVAMRDAGLMPSDKASLDSALDTLAANGTDSDSDGVSDIDELKAGQNPNGGNAFCVSETGGGGGGSDTGFPGSPSYGCLNTAPVGQLGASMAGAALAIVLRRRVKG